MRRVVCFMTLDSDSDSKPSSDDSDSSHDSKSHDSWMVCSKAVFIHFPPKLNGFWLNIGNFKALEEGDDSSHQ